MFGRATIMLGIGPHSGSYCIITLLLHMLKSSTYTRVMKSDGRTENIHYVECH